MTPLGVAVISGKGGTGKTLIALNTAMELISSGESVALVDGDFSNPNLLTMMGVDPNSIEVNFTSDHRITSVSFPDEVPGLEFFSIELLAKNRGIGKSGVEYARTIDEIIREGVWTAKYMIIDSPAGYYDIHKQIVKSFDEKYLGSVIVSNPAHSKDLVRILELHRINEIPVIGVVENMSYFDCPTCQTSHYIFGKSKTKEIAEKYNVKILGQIPLSQKIRDKLENEGVAYVVEEYREPIRNIANEILSAKPRKAGFLQRISEKITDVIRESVLTSILQILKIANKSVPVSNLMNQFGFPGGRLIRLNLMDQDMKEAVGTLHLRIKDGVIKIVRDIGGSQPDVIVDIYYKALAWAMLKRKPTEDGEVAYDFWSALWNDELRVYGGERSHEQMRSWYVLSAVLENVRQYAPEEIENLMKVFA